MNNNIIFLLPTEYNRLKLSHLLPHTSANHSVNKKFYLLRMENKIYLPHILISEQTINEMFKKVGIVLIVYLLIPLLAS